MSDVDEVEHDLGPRPRRRITALLGQQLYEPQTRALPALATAQLELVGERADDRDPEAAFGQLFLVPDRLRVVEAAAVVADLDDEAVGLELVEDLHRSRPLRIRVAD